MVVFDDEVERIKNVEAQGGLSCQKQKRRKCSEMRQNMGKARSPEVSNRTLLAKQKGEGVKCT